MTDGPFLAFCYPRRSAADDPDAWSRERPYEKLTRISASGVRTADDIMVRTTWVCHLGLPEMESAWTSVWRDGDGERGSARSYVYPLPVSAGGLEEAHNHAVARSAEGGIAALDLGEGQLLLEPCEALPAVLPALDGLGPAQQVG